MRWRKLIGFVKLVEERSKLFGAGLVLHIKIVGLIRLDHYHVIGYYARAASELQISFFYHVQAIGHSWQLYTQSQRGSMFRNHDTGDDPLGKHLN